MNYLKLVFIILILLFLIGGGFLIYDYFQSTDEIIFNKSDIPDDATLPKEGSGKTVLFVGDIMLDRGVEYLIEKNDNVFYPFEKISQFLNSEDIVFGNLEGPINEEPQYFPDSSLRFSFSSEVIEGLISANLNLLSLANNHTLNMGQEGLKETRELLNNSGIDFVGDPVQCSQDFSFEKDNIKFLAINKTFHSNCENEEIVETIKIVKLQSPDSFLVVYMHWGEEYQQNNSFLQEELAHQMIDAGVDLIVGSHPHVVQNIEIYKEKLIFYSLGNFVFDQYFSEETQESLAVKAEIKNDEFICYLFPIRSSSAQPSLMKKEESDEFLEDLAQRSSEELTQQIKAGIIKVNL